MRTRNYLCCNRSALGPSDVLRYAPSMADWERLARYIVDARVTRGWSQAELAERAGVKANTISAIETAKGTARRATLARVDRALNWRPGSGERVLDGGEPEREPEPGEGRPDWLTDHEAAIWDAMAAGGYPVGERRGVIAYLRAQSEIRRVVG